MVHLMQLEQSKHAGKPKSISKFDSHAIMENMTKERGREIPHNEPLLTEQLKRKLPDCMNAKNKDWTPSRR
jgi:hypothetical protein